MLVPGGFVQKTGHFVVHQDPLIPLPGFLVIASLRHIRSISEMQDTEYQELSVLIRSTQYAIKESVRVESLTLVQEESSTHFHLWFFPWTQNVIERYGSPSLSKIRTIMSDFRTHPIVPNQWKELQETLEQLKARMLEFE